MAKKYQLVRISDGGKITRATTTTDRADGAVFIIARALLTDHATTPFETLLSMVGREQAFFGRQTAFCDEQATYVATWLYS